MVNISFPCQLTTKLRKGTLEEGSGTANETALKCAVNFTSLESFYLPKLGGSCCLSGSRYNRPRNTIISHCTYTYNNERPIIIFANFFYELRPTGYSFTYSKMGNAGNVAPYLVVSVCYVCQLYGVAYLFFRKTQFICDIYSP